MNNKPLFLCLSIAFFLASCGGNGSSSATNSEISKTSISEKTSEATSFVASSKTIEETSELISEATSELKSESEIESESEILSESESEAEIEESLDLSYYQVEDGIRIISYTGNEEEVIIPEQINGKNVVSIGAFTFAENYRMKKLTLPSTLRHIGYKIIYGCVNLEELFIPEGVVDISSYAFYDCPNLKRVSLPNSLEYIGKDAFSGYYDYGAAKLDYNEKDGLGYLGNESNPYLYCAQL